MIRNGFDVGQVAIRNTLHKIIERVDSDESATSLQSLIRFLVESGMNVNWQVCWLPFLFGNNIDRTFSERVIYGRHFTWLVIATT